MDEWVDYLHVEFLGEHILFRFLRLQSFWSFILGSIVITVICLVERYSPCRLPHDACSPFVLTILLAGF